MNEKRRKEREKRAANRKKIALILLGLALVVMIAGYFIAQVFVWPAGFILPVAAAYGLASWWEYKELGKQD